jgi:hypothetical protein
VHEMNACRTGRVCRSCLSACRMFHLENHWTNFH